MLKLLAYDTIMWKDSKENKALCNHFFVCNFSKKGTMISLDVKLKIFSISIRKTNSIQLLFIGENENVNNVFGT